MKTTRLFLLILTLITLASCSKSEIDGGIKTLALDSGQAALTKASNLMSTKLLSDLSKDGESFVYSPISMDFALGMLATGTNGEALEELLSVLSPDMTDASQLNSYNKKLLETLPGLDKRAKLSFSNSAFLNESRGVKWMSTYKKDMKSFYDAKFDSFEDSFETGLTTLAFLVNSTYMKANWSKKFDDSANRYRRFTKSDGSTVEMYMMHDTRKAVPYFENDLFQAISLNLGYDTFDYTILLPKEGSTVSDAFEWLGENSVSGLPFETSGVRMFIPKMHIDNTVDITSALKAAGVRKVFDCGNLAGMFSPSGQAYVEKIYQNATIDLDENGISATAESTSRVGWLSDNIGGKEMTFDANHPFIFMIREKANGIILFYGMYNG